MRRKLPGFPAIALLAVPLTATPVLVRAAAAPHFWSQRFGSTLTDQGRGVAVDASGNVFVTGSFSGTVNFGGVGLVSAGNDDVFLAKYDADGTHQWSQRFGSTSVDVGLDVAVDGAGNVIVSGSFNGTVNFGGGALASAGLTDIFVAKYNASGVHQWSQRFGSTDYDLGNSVAADGSGNVLITGYFNGTVNFGGAPLASAGIEDIFLAKYDAAGVHQWSQRFGSTNYDVGNSVASDGSGNALVTGSFRETVSFGGAGLISAGLQDVFVAKYGPGGVHQWSRRFGSTGVDGGQGVDVDAAGNVFLTGGFSETVDFGGGGLTSAGIDDVFLAKYNVAGLHQWSRHFGGTGSDGGLGVAVDESGNVVLAGLFSGTVDFGGGMFTSAGTSDIFVAKYDGGSAHRWSQRMGGTPFEIVYGVATDGFGNALVTGTFAGTVDFGGGGLASAGGNDIFLAKYGADSIEPVVTSIVDVGNDQGRQVKISFARSGYDNAGTPVIITRYEAYRRDGSLPSAGATEWVFVGAVPAHGEGDYKIVTPTLADSTLTTGQHYSAFFVRAATSAALTFFDSPPDSGYSLDNLAPSVPTSFVYQAGLLSWTAPGDADVDHFSIYGSSSERFDASARLVAVTRTTTFKLSATHYEFYYVTATDASGNEGNASRVNTIRTGGAPAPHALGIDAYPNPFNPRTTIHYDVPARGRVVLSIYDARGAWVTTLVDAELAAGSYPAAWDGTAARGTRMSSGVYFARLEFGNETRTKKVVLLK